MATHDRELLDDLRDDYDCYYFESHIMDENVVFDYLIHPGSRGTNAIALLRSFHFPDEILDAGQSG